MYDIIIKNGTVIDGSGNEGFPADVAIKNGKIAKIGLDLGDAKQVLDAKGLVVTPGFIDSHSHADRSIFISPEQIEKVEQGITTNIAGQCGATAYPIKKDGVLTKYSTFSEKAYKTPQGANIASFVGHSAIRKAVMGMDVRPATEEELEQMKDLLRDAMDAGAMGISFGLIYSPSCYSTTEELVELAKVAKEKNGMISAHIRNESAHLIESVEEFITIVKAANIRGVLSHHKAAYAPNHGKVKTTLQMLKAANAEGYDIYCDVYPYIASSTSLKNRFIPKAYMNNQLSENLKDPAMRKFFRENNGNDPQDDFSWVLLCECSAYPQYAGLRLNEVAKMHGKDPTETAFDILEKLPDCSACYFSMCEEDVETVMAWDRAMICTDSDVAKDKKFYHPRLRGSFPRVLGRYVRERQVTSLPEMIRKMTSLPAKVYDFTGKGMIQEGYDADICVFDPDTIIDNATYLEPSHRADGLRWVLVGGKIAAENSVSTGICSGKVLFR